MTDLHYIPREANGPEGCDCGGTVHHRAAFNGRPACALLSLPHEEIVARIDAAEAHTIDYVAEYNRMMHREQP